MMTDRFDMVAKTFLGLEGVLADELRALGAEDVAEGNRVVYFKGNKEILYRANFACRTAVRILKPVLTLRSTSAVRAPVLAAARAAIKPAVPPPQTSTSKSYATGVFKHSS